MAKTKVHMKIGTGGGNIEAQAVLTVTQVKTERGSGIQFALFGEGEPRKLVDNILDAMQQMMREDEAFEFED